MNLDKYQIKTGENLATFEFVSEGPNGKIQKVVQFILTRYQNIFNLAFGDKDLETGEIDDFVISNNGDTEKVLATIVASIYIFSEQHPECWIYATGSTKARTRLYRIGISKYLSEAEKDFEIFGQIDGEWESFEREKNYEAFAIKRIYSNLEL